MGMQLSIGKCRKSKKMLCAAFHLTPQTPTWWARYLVLTLWGIARPNYSVKPTGRKDYSRSTSFAPAHWAKASPDTLLGEVGSLSKRGCGQIPFWFCCAGKDGVSTWERTGLEQRSSNSELQFCFLSSVIPCWFCNLLVAGKNIVFKGLP